MRMTKTETDLMAKAQEIVAQNLNVQDSPEKKLFLAALSIIEDREQWCQGQMARFLGFKAIHSETFLNLNHTMVKYKRDERWAVCSIGAIHKADGWDCDSSKNLLSRGVAHMLCVNLNSYALRKASMPITSFNDTHSHTEVVNMWRAFGRERGWL